ncbi:MAG: hypothetical protein WBA10_18915 [Elainellaceae cyanobacterium]
MNITWKPLRWWIVALLALFLTFWASGGYAPVQADEMHQDTFKLGGDVIIAETQTVENAFTIGGDLTVEPNAVVQGDAFAIGGTVRLQENAQVKGNAFAIGGRLVRAETAAVDGSEFTALEGASGLFERFGIIGTLYLANVAFWLASFAVGAIAGLLVLLLLPGHVEAIALAIHDRPLTSLVYGIGGVASLTVLTVLTAGSALGAIAMPLANLVAILTALLGGIAVCVWLGQQLQRKPGRYFRHFWVGLLVLFVISLIPMVGGLLVSLLCLFGFGATLLVRYGTRHATDTALTLDRLEHQPE